MKQPQDWHLILASASPRRHSLLSAMGVECQVQASNVPEVLAPNETPAEYVGRLARSKAESILSKNKAKNTIVLAADTTVVMGDQILEKPIDFDDAVRMWELLSDRQHDVLTGVCVHSHRESAIRVVTTQVSMRKISSSAMRAYWDSGEPCDKAGAYAIQGRASAWVSSVSGSFSNVVGLPLFETNELLVPFGLNWL